MLINGGIVMLDEVFLYLEVGLDGVMIGWVVYYNFFDILVEVDVCIYGMDY